MNKNKKGVTVKRHATKLMQKKSSLSYSTRPENQNHDQQKESLWKLLRPNLYRRGQPHTCKSIPATASKFLLWPTATAEG
jgi:hypothetical protein